ncbi:MAG: serine/threonine protein kinase [Deltaproteobacteria bacterium]|nr:serine/threonine protein kinase [Deltaproteobacteria bacterium]
MARCAACQFESAEGSPTCPRCGLPLEPPRLDPRDPLIGKVLRDTYVIQERVGGGGMGTVYRAAHLKLGAPVAVKILKRALRVDAALVQRFYREARAASHLRHPNVIAVTDFGETDGGTLFMVMEYVLGRNLATILAAEGPQSPRRIVHVGAQVLSALAEAHAHQILHRDVKPANLMLESHRDALDLVKVLDFGIARIRSPAEDHGAHTQVGLVFGTLGYMSPEQLAGEELDERSDLYAVGVVLYQMLTGTLPFPIQGPVEMLHRQLAGPPLPAIGGVQLPVGDLEALLLRALAPRRDDRPNSAEEMRQELLAAQVAETPAGGTPRVAPTLWQPGGREERSPGGEPRADVAGPPSPTTPLAGGGRAPGSGGFDEQHRLRIEQLAAPYLGPISRYLVSRAQASAPTPTDLCVALSRFIGSERERAAFLAAVRSDALLTPPSGRVAQAAAAGLPPALVELVTRRLAAHVGPVARLLVQRACRRAATADELWELVAREIPAEADRVTFLRGRPAPGHDP